MKKYLSLLLGVCFFFLFPKVFFAASFSISSSTKEVSPNSTFTISVGGDAIGRVNLSVKNGTLSTTSVWVEQNKQTVTVKAGASGQVVVTATPQKGFSDADANEYQPGAKSVSVSIVTKDTNTKPTNPSNPSSSNKPSSNQKPSTNQKPSGPTKSSNNLLSSLQVSSGELSPAFQENVLEYSLHYSHDVTSITLSATAKDSKSQVEGLGEKSLKTGENSFSIVVTAENGEKKTYQIKAYVEELPEVYLSYLDENIGVLKDMKGVTIPKEFEKKEISKDEKTITIFSHDDISIVYGMNSNQEKGFYVFDEESFQCNSKFLPIKLLNREFYSVDLKDLNGFEKSSIEINQQTISGYQFSRGMDSYFLLSFLDSNGEVINYLYEKNEGTLQQYSDQAMSFYQDYDALQEKLHRQQIFFSVVCVLFLIFLVLFGFLVVKRKGKTHEALA